MDSLRVVDAVLKVETPFGPCWHRYNNDGYGQKEDGGPFVGWGKGRGWPLLAGERGHYELAAGHDAKPFIRAMEGFSSPQVSCLSRCGTNRTGPDVYMLLGRPTGSAMPLMWAHAEYIKLLRSVADGQVFDLIPEVAERYLSGRNTRHLLRGVEAQSSGASIRRAIRFASRPSLRFVCIGRAMNGIPSKIPRLLVRHSELTLWMSPFPRSSERRSDSHSFGQIEAHGKAVIIWSRSNCRSNWLQQR